MVRLESSGQTQLYILKFPIFSTMFRISIVALYLVIAFSSPRKPNVLNVRRELVVCGMSCPGADGAVRGGDGAAPGRGVGPAGRPAQPAAQPAAQRGAHQGGAAAAHDTAAGPGAARAVQCTP
jgi:hypothetical protein